MTEKIRLHTVNELSALFHQGELFAYPTEAVFGLGCCPKNETAVLTLCTLKKRPIEKGLILVASEFELLRPYIDESKLSQSQLAQIQAYWPGPVTWVMPTKQDTPYFLKGQFDTLAVRVSSHPTVRALSSAFQSPIVSTSANLTGYPPAKTAQEVFLQFGTKIAIAEGEVGDLKNPTVIKDALSGQIIRP